jgi:hypothetical protein
MSTCKQTNIPELNIVVDPCGGDKPSTNCIIHAELISMLNLPANSTQTQINAAIVAKLVDLEERITLLENP